MDLKKAEWALKEVAKQNGVTLEEVRQEISKALLEGMNRAEPQAKKAWDKVTGLGRTPSPEEFIAYIANCVKNKLH